MPAASTDPAALLSLEPELQVQVLRGLGPADLRSARLACCGLRGLVDTQVVTGPQLDVVQSPRYPKEQEGLYWPERQQEDRYRVTRLSLADLQAEEASIRQLLGEEILDLQQLATQLVTSHNKLIHEQQSTAELQLLAQQYGLLVEMLGQHKRLHEVRMQQLEVRLEQAEMIQGQIQRQLKCMATAEEAVGQLTAFKGPLPSRSRLRAASLSLVSIYVKP